MTWLEDMKLRDLDDSVVLEATCMRCLHVWTQSPVQLLLKVELRGVHPYYYQALVLIFCIPLIEIGNGALAIDAGVCPEVDKHYALAKIVGEMHCLPRGCVYVFIYPC